MAGLDTFALGTIGTNTYNGVAKYPLIAIPLFVLTGMIFERSGVAQKLVDFASALVGPRRGGLAVVAVLVCMLMGGMSGSGPADAAAVATAAATLNTYFPFGDRSYYAYILFVGMVVLTFTIFGAKLVRDASTIMGLGILISAVAIFAVGIAKAPNMGGIIAASYAADGFSKLPQAVLTAFTYAGFQCVVIPTMIVCGVPLFNRRACARSMWISFGLNAVALVLSVFMLMGWAPFFTSVAKGTTIPTLTSCREMGIGWLTATYTVCLLLCLISTGVTTVFGFTARFEKLRIFHSIKSAPVRCAIVSGAIIVLAMTVSLAGLTNIIKYGYGYCGYLAIAIIIVPFLTVGVYKNRAFVRAHPEYQGMSHSEARQGEARADAETSVAVGD